MYRFRRVFGGEGGRLSGACGGEGSIVASIDGVETVVDVLMVVMLREERVFNCILHGPWQRRCCWSRCSF